MPSFCFQMSLEIRYSCRLGAFRLCRGGMEVKTKPWRQKNATPRSFVLLRISVMMLFLRYEQNTLAGSSLKQRRPNLDGPERLGMCL